MVEKLAESQSVPLLRDPRNQLPEQGLGPLFIVVLLPACRFHDGIHSMFPLFGRVYAPTCQADHLIRIRPGIVNKDNREEKP
ncbi:MAG: hypothetical protein ACKOED_15605 [Aestuariivirga sp.]|uniref:hypothetical protein n=1 Tax=Aestuariivirga sp. TaxID=2650926 RepID=UPI0038CFFFF9